MNKKTKSFAVGLVAVLCFLLVFAIGFGVTGAWYQAQRQATGIVELNQGIKIQFTNLGNLNPAETGDIANKVEGKLLYNDGTSNKVLNVPGVPQASYDVVSPTIAQTADSVDFYARARVVYTYLLWTDATRTTLKYKDDTTKTGYTATELGLTDADVVATPIAFAEAWKETTDGWYAYTESNALAKVGTIARSMFTDTNLVLADWTSEFGGPEGTLAGDSVEIGQVIVTLEIDVLQYANNPNPWTLK